MVINSKVEKRYWPQLMQLSNKLYHPYLIPVVLEAVKRLHTLPGELTISRISHDVIRNVHPELEIESTTTTDIIKKLRSRVLKSAKILDETQQLILTKKISTTKQVAYYSVTLNKN